MRDEPCQSSDDMSYLATPAVQKPSQPVLADLLPLVWISRVGGCLLGSSACVEALDLQLAGPAGAHAPVA